VACGAGFLACAFAQSARWVYGIDLSRRMGEKGQETREVKPGDILNLPRGKPHGFETQGDKNLVLLVVATAGWKPLEDTKFDE
jgi:mannose-6-phosphate isomerase-like protein (cupin superfamily)